MNNTLDGIANGTINPTNAEIQSLITQINNYNEFGASFTGAQGGVFGDRFDNELLSGTLKTDTANAVAGLQSIEANGLNATNAAQIVAAGVGFVADANDVSGNNLPTGGGAYVGSATTVPGATTTAAATVGTTVPVDGAVDGNDNLTNTPVNGLTNNGFGSSNPNPNGNSEGNQAGGDSGTGNAGAGSGGGNGQGNQGSGYQGSQACSSGGDDPATPGNQDSAGGGNDVSQGFSPTSSNRGAWFANHEGGREFASAGAGDLGHGDFNLHQMAQNFFEHLWHHG